MNKKNKIFAAAAVFVVGALLGTNGQVVYGKAAAVKQPKAVYKAFGEQSGDVNGDGIKERVYFSAKDTGGLYEDVHVIVQNKTTKKRLAKLYIGEYANNVDNSITLADFDGDGIKDIMAVVFVGGTDGAHECAVYTLKNNKPKLLPINTNEQWDSKLVIDEGKYLVEFTANFSDKKYVIDISKDEYIKLQRENSEFYTQFEINMDGRGPYYKAKDINKDGKTELVISDECDGLCHADALAEVNIYYEYDKSGKWIAEDYDIDAYYPVIK